ncbi:MAG: metallophosphoesterase [Candidatus Brocadia sinica]|nr:metallophosphoesterase [Candidatus Brocadia sinica]
MKIGILADTHDNIAAIHKTVSFFNAQDIKYVIHAGDYVAPFSLKELMKLKAKFIGVFGNNDGERRGLSDVCKNIHEPPYDLLLNGKHIMVTHMLESLKEGSPLYVNPGECGAWLSGKSTVAVLDLETSRAEIVDLSEVSLDKG